MKCMSIIMVLMVSAGMVAASAPLHLKLVTSAVAKGAVCLDGTAPGYYFRAGNGTGANKWVVHHQGGGWCYDTKACVERSKTALGSSKSWPATTNTGGIFNQDAKINPDFHNWNFVYLQYCDGASFSGNVDQPVVFEGTTIYMRGFRVLNALLADLPLNTATHILVSGCSAGGLATYLHADRYTQLYPQATVKAMPDAGFFMDVPDWHGNYSIRAKYANVFKMQNATGGVNQACIANTKPDDHWQCFMAQYTVLHMRTPVFVFNSLYDSWQLGNILLLPSTCAKDPTTCTSGQRASFDNLHTSMIKALTPVMSASGDGIWALSCLVHCMSTGDGFWNHIHVRGNLAREVVGNWYFERSGTHHVEDVKWPQNTECPKPAPFPTGPRVDWWIWE